jgi:hypothetical protein
MNIESNVPFADLKGKIIRAAWPNEDGDMITILFTDTTMIYIEECTGRGQLKCTLARPEELPDDSDDAREAARYRMLQSLNFPEAARIMQYKKEDADSMLDALIEERAKRVITTDVRRGPFIPTLKDLHELFDEEDQKIEQEKQK